MKVARKVPQAYKYLEKKRQKQERKAAKARGDVVPGGTSLSKKNVKPVIAAEYAQACTWHIIEPFDGCKTCMKFKEKQL